MHPAGSKKQAATVRSSLQQHVPADTVRHARSDRATSACPPSVCSCVCASCALRLPVCVQRFRPVCETQRRSQTQKRQGTGQDSGEERKEKAPRTGTE
jgi:hypothetical protein